MQASASGDQHNLGGSSSYDFTPAVHGTVTADTGGISDLTELDCQVFDVAVRAKQDKLCS